MWALTVVVQHLPSRGSAVVCTKHVHSNTWSASPLATAGDVDLQQLCIHWGSATGSTLHKENHKILFFHLTSSASKVYLQVTSLLFLTHL